MRTSNFLLSFLAVVLFVITCSIVLAYTNIVPTSIINIPYSDATNGGGVSIKIPDNFSKRQTKLLNMAYDIAKDDGHEHPQLLQGIILKESHAGGLKSYKVAGHEFGLKANERYYGVAQIKLAAARDVLKRFPELMDEFNFHTKTDEEVIAKLIENDKFNLSVASKYLLILQGYGYNTIKLLALAYNQGPGGAKNHNASTHQYSKGVMQYIQQLKKENNSKV